MSRHTTVFRNSSAGVRVEEISSVAAHIIVSGPPAGTQIAIRNLSGPEIFALGSRLVEISKGMRAAGGRTPGDEPKRLLTAEDVAFNRATVDCEAWCKVNLQEDLKGDVARKRALDEVEGLLFPKLYDEALQPLLADIAKDEEASGLFSADGASIKSADLGSMNVARPKLSAAVRKLITQRDAPVVLSKAEARALREAAKKKDSDPEGEKSGSQST